MNLVTNFLPPYCPDNYSFSDPKLNIIDNDFPDVVKFCTKENNDKIGINKDGKIVYTSKKDENKNEYVVGDCVSKNNMKCIDTGHKKRYGITENGLLDASKIIFDGQYENGEQVSGKSFTNIEIKGKKIKNGKFTDTSRFERLVESDGNKDNGTKYKYSSCRYGDAPINFGNMETVTCDIEKIPYKNGQLQENSKILKL